MTTRRPSPFARRPSPVAGRPSPVAVARRPSPVAHRPSIAHRPSPRSPSRHPRYPVLKSLTSGTTSRLRRRALDQGHERRRDSRRSPARSTSRFTGSRNGAGSNRNGDSPNNRKAKYYELTAAGQRHLKAKAREFTVYAHAMFKILETGLTRTQPCDESERPPPAPHRLVPLDRARRRRRTALSYTSASR